MSKRIKTLTLNLQNIEFILSVDKFDNLIASTIFPLTLKEFVNCDVILVNNSIIFNGKYKTTFWEKYFSKIISMSQINKNNLIPKISYDGCYRIDKAFNKILALQKRILIRLFL